MKELIILLIVVMSIVMCLWTIVWLIVGRKKAERENFEWEKARRHAGIKRGVAEYLQAKKKWEEEGDNHDA